MTNWLKESNRPKHVWAGLLLYITACLAAAPFMWQQWPNIFVSAFIATTAGGASAEVKDELWGGSSDILDLLATILIPAIITAAALIVAAII